MRAVYSYRRVSSAGQAENDRYGLPEQKKAIDDYAASKGWKIAEDFKDIGISGKVPMGQRREAPLLLDLLSDEGTPKDEQPVVIVHTLDRLARSVVGGLKDFNFINKRARLVILDIEGLGLLDASTAQGELMLTMLLAFAQFERRQIGGRMMRGRKGKARAEGWSGGRPPFGYAVGEDGRLVTNEEEAKTVVEAFRLFLDEGLSPAQVAARLNAAEMFPRPYLKRSHKKVLLETPREVRPKWAYPALIGGHKRVGPKPEKGEPDTREQTYYPGLLTRGIYGGEGVVKVHGDEEYGIEEFNIPATAIIDPERLAQSRARVAKGRTRRTQDRYAGRPKGWKYGLAGMVYHEHEEGVFANMGGTTRKGVRRYACSTDCPGFGISKYGGQTIKSLTARELELRTLGRPGVGGLLDFLTDPDALAKLVTATEQSVYDSAGGAEGIEKMKANLAALIEDQKVEWTATYKASLRAGEPEGKAEREADDAAAKLAKDIGNLTDIIDRAASEERQRAHVAKTVGEVWLQEVMLSGPGEGGQTVKDALPLIEEEVLRVASSIESGEEVELSTTARAWLRHVMDAFGFIVVIEGEGEGWHADITTQTLALTVSGTGTPRRSSTSVLGGLKTQSSIRSSPTGSP